jgi:hypothetical protein
MHNQHAGLSQLLAEQRITDRHEQATHARLVRGAPSPRRRHRRWAARGWWQLARREHHAYPAAKDPETQAAQRALTRTLAREGYVGWGSGA